MAYLGKAGGTGQVLTVSGGAPVWQASSPSLLWEADLTTGQTAQSWTAGSTYAVVGSSGTGNINFKHQGITSGGSAAATVTMVNGSGLEILYSNNASAGSVIHCTLSQLGLSYMSGRPWRFWLYWTSSGTITAGNDNQQMFFDLDGTGATNTSGVPTSNASWARTYSSGGSGTSCGSGNIATDQTNTSSSSVWFSSNVMCASFSPGCAAVSLGSYSGGWPDQQSLYPFIGGAYAPAQFGYSSQYQNNSGICLRWVSTGAVNFTSRKIIIKAMRIEGL